MWRPVSFSREQDERLTGIHELRAVLLKVVRDGDDHTARQLALMLCLHDSGSKTIRALAEELNVIRPVVCRGVDRLVDDHYAERLDDPADRRSVLVRLTRQGRKFVESMVADAPMEAAATY
jgi:DNA-binding MarR family transcriptional regulator